jgi:hypothetical protein
MNWAALVKVLIEVFRPLLKKWLDELLKKVAADLEAAGASYPADFPALAVADVFGTARAEVLATYWFPRRALAALDQCQRAALARANEVRAAAVGSAPVPALTRDQIDRLAKL